MNSDRSDPDSGRSAMRGARRLIRRVLASHSIATEIPGSQQIDGPPAVDGNPTGAPSEGASGSSVTRVPARNGESATSSETGGSRRGSRGGRRHKRRGGRSRQHDRAAGEKQARPENREPAADGPSPRRGGPVGSRPPSRGDGAQSDRRRGKPAGIQATRAASIAAPSGRSSGDWTGRLFGEIELRPETAGALDAMGYETPTEIQVAAIPPMLAGRDVVGQAQTGSGKTAAYGIPIVERIEPGAGATQAIVLVPTRELATQVAEEMASLGRGRGIGVVPVYGGQPIGKQLRLLENEPEVVVGTPGRVMDHISRRTISLRNVGCAILDEADRMLDVGFAEDMEWILSRTPRKRQTALFSATIPSFVRRLIRRYMDDPEWIRIGLEIQTVDEVEQFYSEIAERDKVAGMKEILDDIDEDAQVLVFCEMQVGVDRLVRRLQGQGYPIMGLHGGMAQRDRDAVMHRFRDGTLTVLASTNLAARGIDIPAITHVVNFDMPDNVEEYVHRIGRTARMGRKGTAVSLIGEWDLEMLEKVKRQVGEERLKYRATALYD